jgi:Ca-activated chloride channel homolog
MARQSALLSSIFLAVFCSTAAWLRAQKPQPNVPVFRVTVDMVQLDIAVTDKKGNYVTGLSPLDFEVYEDGILQKIAAFGEENEAPRALDDLKRGESVPKSEESPSQGNPVASLDPKPSPTGASVFILFDTSNYMYRGFVSAQDAIAQFVRSVHASDRMAFYSYSRDFFRACMLTEDRSQVLHGVRSISAGDNAALYDALLWTLKDADKFKGKRVVVVFSNGPDNASMISPEDVRELAQTEGIPIYMISTQEARKDPLSTAVFVRVSDSTGGKAYFARNWEDQEKAFASIRDDLSHLYTMSYYPQPNPNQGWRSIEVKLVGKALKKYRVRTRSGYRPRTPRAVGATASSPESGAFSTGSFPN